ncbi:MAG: indoleamine 2,3-dioxygenase [Hyphomonadaceae bacterium]|nr:indoleamine 2,3-dioxygenase [Hyphomonadaceae bacterium]
MAATLSLSDHDMSAERGFLCSYDSADVTLPRELSAPEEAARELPRTLLTGRVRKHLKALPVLDLAGFCAGASEAEVRTAMVRYAFMVQAYVWGEADAPTVLPAQLAVPMWQLARRLGQQPLLPYSAYVLDNWDRLDRSAPIGLDNIWMIQNFLGGQDEAWFVLVHVAIEARAGGMLAEIPGLIAAADGRDERAVEAGLAVVNAGWDDVNAIFDRMPERCDPYVYFHRVRPYIHGWKDNPALSAGLIYEGVAETGGRPQAFRGQTGSQSTIVPSMDALLGVGHAADPLRTFLDELHVYRPPAHRTFVDEVRARSHLRDFIVKSGSPVLRDLYNTCVMSLARFRTRHLEYAASYIAKQNKDSAGNDTDVGTGGTPFMKYLKKHRDEAEQHLLK